MKKVPPDEAFAFIYNSAFNSKLKEEYYVDWSCKETVRSIREAQEFQKLCYNLSEILK